MKKLVTTLCTVAALAVVANVSFAANAVRISQVYGGGGGGGAATYTQDYIELFNFSNATVNISNWALEYGSATGNWGSAAGNYFVFPANTTIPPCSYLLVTCGTVGTGGATIPIASNFNGAMNMSATGGKVGLFNALNANLACGSELPGTLVDKVAYGTANCPEVTAVGATSITTGAVRNGGGNTDTDNNLADFSLITNPVPHNLASGASVNCLSVPAMNSTWGQLKTIYR
jgi:hypothetical protein